MGYIEDIRSKIGHQPIILVRPSVGIVNAAGEILLVKYPNQVWGIPGGLMELGESTEQCAIREIKEEIGLNIRNLKLIAVYSGEQFYTKLLNGDEYYNVLIGYLCTDYDGEIKPDGVEVLEARFFNMNALPERTSPFIKETIGQLSKTILSGMSIFKQ